MSEYITDIEFETLLEDIQEKLKSNKVEECEAMLKKIIEDGKNTKSIFKFPSR